MIFCSLVWSQEPLKYTVSVDMHITPIYAVDNKGKPVFDIKKEEFDLLVNGKAVEFQLLRYDFSMGEKNDNVKKTFKDINLKKNRNNRVIILIFDAMYNSQIGIGRSKKMAESIINDSKPGNYFILMENTKSKGLRYIVGPETDKGKLKKYITQITDFPEKYRRNLFSIQGYDAAADRIMENDPEEINMLQMSHMRLEQKRYINSIKSFSRSLANLRYILKSIDLPKSVILFSEGIANGAFKKKENKRRMLLFKMLRHSIQSITRTGTMVYTVNPQLRDPFTEQVGPMDSGENSLRFIANEGGGQYFSSPTKEAMVENLNNSISAYYELAFPQDIKTGVSKSIKIICKRRGINISTLNRIERKKTYLELDKIEKKMFALNIVFNSRWLSQMEEVAEAVYRSSEVKQKVDSVLNTLDVKIPENMKNRKADIFLVRVGEDRQKSEIERFSRILKPLETIKINIAKGSRNFFVIVDQVSSVSIFGNGDWRSKNWKVPASIFKKDFYSFFHRFKNDEQFQLSHTSFPFERQRFDPVSGKLLTIKKIPESEWEFTTFESTPTYTWSEPEVTRDRAIIHLSISYVKISLIFGKKDGKWTLLRSENKSKFK